MTESTLCTAKNIFEIMLNGTIQDSLNIWGHLKINQSLTL